MSEQSGVRDLGLLERMFLAFTQTGQLRPISHLITYPNKDAAPSPDALKQRLAELGTLYPILSARVDASDPSHPHYVSTGTLPDVYEWTHAPAEGWSNIAHDLLDQIYAKTAELDTVKGPLIRVDYITTPASRQVFIGLSADHTIADGAGVKTFMQLLLASQLPELKKEALYDNPIEEVIDFLPPPAPPPADKDIWPTKVRHPINVPGAHAHFDYPVSIIDRLKPLAKAHRVATLNPVLEMVFMAALLSVVPTADEFTFYTMRDDRKSCGDKAPLWSSNYFSNPTTSFKPLPNIDFWSQTKSHADYLKDPATHQAGRYAVGFLGNVPIPLDQLLEIKTNSDHPYIGSLFFTNMTNLELPPGAEDFHWTSSPSPYLGPVIVHWVGHKAGLRLSLSYRNGAGITKDEAGRIGEKVGVVLERLANGAEGSFEEIAKT